ncbi:response regulator [Massilia forsythiae]|uniref:Response regulator n=1 Tax=Massilia forsythiae TaxID=2728020 RepID=A0A7Z2ZTQ0_9BURK|nr:response regulator [Massilia forsythiae]QJE01826.1 response regulator [Massilia forsythiae]
MEQAFSGRRVLVVDDNADAAELVGEVMSLHGHDVVVAHGGKAALAAAATFLPDVVFLDIGMPDMDGYEVACALRRDPSFDTARIVALTAWGDLASRARAVACGFDGHLVKPAMLDSLINEAALAR